MDPQHHYEFDHRDDWQVFKEDFGAWWAKHGNRLLIIILLIVLAFTVYRLYTLRQQESHENAWADLANITSPDVARNTAETHENPVRALLYLRGADLLIAKAAQPQNDDPAEQADAAASEGSAEEVNPLSSAAGLAEEKTPQQMLDEAKQLYQLVADDGSIHETIRLNAQLGLAAVAEANKEWDTATSIYENVASSASESYKVIHAQAKGRLAMVDRMRRPVRYAKEAPAPKATVPQVSMPSADGDKSDDSPDIQLPDIGNKSEE